MTTHLAFGIYDPRVLHEIGGVGSLIFLALALLTGLFKFAVRSSADKLSRKDFLSVVKLSLILLFASVICVILWATTRHAGTEQAAAGAVESQAPDRPLYYIGNLNSSNSNVGLSPAVNSNVNSPHTINSNVSNSNNVINSNVNSPTSIFKQQNNYQQQNNSTIIQQGGSPAQNPPQGSRPVSGTVSVSPALSRPLAQPPAPAPLMTKRTDPDLTELARRLDNLRRRGLREADPDAVYASSRDVPTWDYPNPYSMILTQEQVHPAVLNPRLRVAYDTRMRGIYA